MLQMHRYSDTSVIHWEDPDEQHLVAGTAGLFLGTHTLRFSFADPTQLTGFVYSADRLDPVWWRLMGLAPDNPNEPIDGSREVLGQLGVLARLAVMTELPFETIGHSSIRSHTIELLENLVQMGAPLRDQLLAARTRQTPPETDEWGPPVEIAHPSGANPIVWAGLSPSLRPRGGTYTQALQEYHGEDVYGEVTHGVQYVHRRSNLGDTPYVRRVVDGHLVETVALHHLGQHWQGELEAIDGRLELVDHLARPVLTDDEYTRHLEMQAGAIATWNTIHAANDIAAIHRDPDGH